MARFEPRTADFDTRVRESFSKQGLMTAWRARIVHIAPGEVDIAVEHAPVLTQQHGFFHGGVTAALADSACGYAAFTLFEAGAGILTVEFKLNFLSPAAGERLIARGRVEKPGRTLTVCRGEVFAVCEGRESAVATGLFTLMQVAKVAG
jgi:uncharacterized protein (TIGR00369 family)